MNWAENGKFKVQVCNYTGETGKPATEARPQCNREKIINNPPGRVLSVWKSRFQLGISCREFPCVSIISAVTFVLITVAQSFLSILFPLLLRVFPLESNKKILVVLIRRRL